MSESSLKPVSEQALRQSEIVAMRTLSAHIEQLGEQISSLVADMKEVRDKVITFEAVKFEAQLAKLEVEFRQSVLDARAEFRRELDVIHTNNKTREERLRLVEIAAGRFGLVLAAFGTVGGAVCGVLAMKVFGG